MRDIMIWQEMTAIASMSLYDLMSCRCKMSEVANVLLCWLQLTIDCAKLCNEGIGMIYERGRLFAALMLKVAH